MGRRSVSRRDFIKYGVGTVGSVAAAGGIASLMNLPRFRSGSRGGDYYRNFAGGSGVLSRSDTVCFVPNEEAKSLINFRAFPGGYVLHCHDTQHEDR